MDGSPYGETIGKDVFRVLLLEPGDEHDPLAASLELVNVGNAAEARYEALSYVWGDDTVKVSITCNGRAIPITSSLEAALRVLRGQSAVRRLFVDQICINQARLDEQSAQVSIMGSVYRSALRVVVWLGPSSLTTDLAISFASSLNHAVGEFRNKYPGKELSGSTASMKLPPTGFEVPPAGDSQWEAVKALLERPWFSRYWVIQEIKLNPSTVAYCGTRQFAWSVCVELCHNLESYSFLMRGLRGNGGTPAGYYFLQSVMGTETSSDMEHLVLAFSNQSVGRDCDRLYALLGIANGPAARSVVADYRLSTEEIFTNFALASMRENGDLNILRFVDPSEESKLKGLPSWVPDWTTRPKNKPGGTRLMWEGHFRASGSCLDHSPFHVSGKGLYLTARLFDTITSHDGMAYVDMQRDIALRPDELEAWTLSDHNRWLQERIEFHLKVESMVNDCQPYSTKEPAASIMCSLLTRNMINGQGLWPTVMVECQRELVELRQNYIEAKRSIEALQDPRAVLRRFLEDLTQKAHIGEGWKRRTQLEKRSIISGLLQEMKGNGIVKTSKRFLANVPHQAAAGDIIAIVNGCKTPLVLRRHPDGFKLIGECYVHGIMFGEVLDMGVEEKEICLV